MNPTLSPEPAPQSSFLPDGSARRVSSAGETPAILADIFEESVNIATWQRTLSDEMQGAVSDVIASNPSLTVAMSVSPDGVFEHISEALGTGRGCLLSQDVAKLVGMFCDLLGIHRAGLRLTVLEKAMCPKFHVDRVPCRLITTYQGVATEWLPHDAVNRSKLGSGSKGLSDSESGLYRTSGDIEQLRIADVALMKGELWENNEGMGLVHRSPAVAQGDARLLLTLDVSD